jgi:hypothetical protein
MEDEEFLMEEEPISFETAVLAKEKGFFDPYHPTLVYDDAPQSLLQRWLREKHKIHITIYSCSQESWMYNITTPHQQLPDGIYGEDFEDYEDALEDALQESLKTI